MVHQANGDGDGGAIWKLQNKMQVKAPKRRECGSKCRRLYDKLKFDNIPDLARHMH